MIIPRLVMYNPGHLHVAARHEARCFLLEILSWPAVFGVSMDILAITLVNLASKSVYFIAVYGSVVLHSA